MQLKVNVDLPESSWQLEVTRDEPLDLFTLKIEDTNDLINES